MSIATTPHVEVAPVTFPRVLRSEWIKFLSLRSSYWLIGSAWLAMIFVAGLMGAGAITIDEVEGVEVSGLTSTFVLASAHSIAQLVIAVLGVLMITGEYATGMIRSTLTATPTRIPVLVAKAAVITLVTFATGVVGVGLAYLVTLPMLDNIGGPASLTDPATLQVFWGTGLYFVGVALLSLAIGTLLRHTAGAIAATLGVFLLLPAVANLVGRGLAVARDISPYLPMTAGTQIIAGSPQSDVAGPELLGPWAGFGVLMAYALTLLVTAAWLLRRRDA